MILISEKECGENRQQTGHHNKDGKFEKKLQVENENDEKNLNTCMY